MSFEPAIMESALAAAIGNDAALMTELRAAFLASARAHVEALARASGDVDRQAAAWRLHGLAASFGALTLMECAGHAGVATRADPALLRQLHAALAALEG